jgi:DNA-binding winged helix-turn-helix (wHTH) protein/tetratricopeptide (TPR) repeat protein/energy-coupling factor transporter ATP-binding protein EcfA2
LIFVFDSYVLDTGRRELRRGHTVVSVQPQVFDLLEYLIRNRGHVISRDELLDAIWGGRIVSESTLATRINAARSAIGDDGESQHLIRTLPRKGIRFVGEVLEEEEEQPRARRAAASPSGATAAVAPRVEAERRHLTVVSCDFVGLRDLATLLDPEELRNVSGACHACCYQVAARWDGTVARVADDGATIHFSYPQAHEDDAERAVRAGLDLIARIKRLETGQSIVLATRIGIATGLVVLGELSGASGNGTAHDRAAFGQAPALAAALRSVTEPDTVLIAASTRGLLGGLFEYEAVGPLALDGFPSTVPAWLITSANVAESRFDALHKTRLTPFSGREEELALLLRQWCEAKADKGQVVLISGEPGIGKSRIVAHLAECITEQGRYTRLLYQCSPYYRDTSLYPFTAQLERYAVIASDDPPTRRLDKLEAIVAIRGPSRQSAMPLLAALLAIPTGERYPPITLTPMQQRRQTLAALLDQLEALAQRQPVLWVFEDVHWADPTSIELLDLMVERIRRLAVLTLITFRPEFKPSWAGLANVSALTLQRLGRRDIQAIVGGVAEGRTLPSEVVEQIISKADGVPLFIEELTKAILESGLLTKDESSYQLSGPLPLLAIPLTLQDSLMARLDRLGPAKEIAQIGAAIGREFSYDLLRAVARIDDIAVRDALDRLEVAELASSRGKPPKAVYTFKHALVQDAAYASLVKKRRAELHDRIATTLIDQFADRAEAEPEIVAHHLTEAGSIEPAIEWWSKAAEQSGRRTALVEAIAHREKAVTLADSSTGPSANGIRRLRLQVALASALMVMKGYVAPETVNAFMRARDFADGVGDCTERQTLYYGLWLTAITRGEINPAREAAEMLLRAVEHRPQSSEVADAYLAYGLTRFFEGHFKEARAYQERAYALGDVATSGPALTYNHWTVAVIGCFAYPLSALGEFELAHRVIEQAIKRAEAGQNIATNVYVQGLALRIVGWYAPVAHIQHLAKMASKAGEHGIHLAIATVRFFENWARWRSGDRNIAIEEMHSAVAVFRGELWTVYPTATVLLAEVEAAVGHVDAALRSLDELLVEVDRSGHHWFDAEIYRQRGELLLRNRNDTGNSAADFERALQIARKQEGKLFELRAAVSLARLWRDQHKRGEARDLLAPIYCWFSSGFDMPDLVAAKALLNELSS